jgi:3-hydroxyisobutyrate dehydrogenase-like beta-hydroxyacid dehydrogenase
MNIAYIGLGRMGAGIAANLLRAGYAVTVYNRSRGKTDALAAAGAKVASSVAEASANADVVITMLADDQATEHVTFGVGGIASALKPGAIHVANSTISTALARHLASEHAGRGQAYLSAPVFGRPEAAEAKKLVVAVAGSSELIAQCNPLFEAIGRRTFVVGSEPWQANALKLCGNFMIASMMEAFSEAFPAMRKAGVDHHLFLDVMNELFASPVYKNYGAAIANEAFEPVGFAMKLGLKDMRLVLQVAQEVAAPMPLASLLHDHFLAGVAQGKGETDWSAISQMAAQNAGL